MNDLGLNPSRTVLLISTALVFSWSPYSSCTEKYLFKGLRTSKQEGSFTDWSSVEVVPVCALLVNLNAQHSLYAIGSGHTMFTFSSAAFCASAVMLTWWTRGMCGTKPSLVSHLSEIPNHASSVSQRTGQSCTLTGQICQIRSESSCGTKFVHCFIMQFKLSVTFLWYGSFLRPRSCMTNFAILSF